MLTDAMLTTPHQVLGAAIVVAVLVAILWLLGKLGD